MLSNMKFLTGDGGNDRDDNADFSSCSFSFPIIYIKFIISLINIITKPISIESEITIKHRI